VWFLGAAMSSRLAWGLRRLWGMPWHRAPVAVSDGAARYRAAVVDRRWPATIEAEEREGGEEVDGFDRLEHAADVLVNARLGLFRGRRGRPAVYRAEHSPPPPRVARPGPARVRLFEELGLVEPGAEPHSVLLVDAFDIAIELPPRHISRR
jgi:hypothetical protein